MSPPAPEQDKVYVLTPVSLSIKLSLPEVALSPFQFHDAEQESALVEDHVSVNSVLVVTLFEEDERDTEGADDV